MSYQHLNWKAVSHPVLRKVLSHADTLLLDVFKMFQSYSKSPLDLSRFNFSIVIILLCIVDGIARDIYPTQQVKDPEKRFKRLLRDKLPWSQSSGSWIDIAEAARHLYLEFRNPLVHELGQNKVTRARRPGFLEPKLGPWGEIDEDSQDIELIDGLGAWNDKWPVLYVQEDDDGPRIKVCCAALYWSVKHMVQDLMEDNLAMAHAEDCQDDLQVRECEE